MYLNRILQLLLGAAFTVVVFTGCDSTDPEDDVPLEATRVENIAADPATRDPNTGQTNESGRYALYSLRENRLVLSSTATDRSDSASTSWDVGFQGTNIIFNGGTSGPGQGAAVIVEDLFEDVTEAPADGAFRVDGQAECPSPTGQPGPRRAICPGSDNGWYNYNPQANLITPIPGRTIVVRTADGRFAKLRIISYYQDAPAAPTETSVPRYYTFEYVFQPDGSRDLATP
jgi:hypothetical protein